jgi:hypothetical protein
MNSIQVPVSSASLNKGDVFILQTDNVIYQWNGTIKLLCFLLHYIIVSTGSLAGRMEKAKALDLTVRLRDEGAAKARIVVLGLLQCD